MPKFVKGVQAWKKEVSTRADEFRFEPTAWNEKTKKWNEKQWWDDDGIYRKHTYLQAIKNNWHILKGYGGNHLVLFGIVLFLLMKWAKFLTFDVGFPLFDVYTDYNATNTHFE